MRVLLRQSCERFPGNLPTQAGTLKMGRKFGEKGKRTRGIVPYQKPNRVTDELAA